MNDKWEFYKDNQDQWRWRRTSPNGNIVGAATEGYVNKGDCEGNARRNGWETEEMIEETLAAEKAQISEKANALYEKHGFKGGDKFAAGFVAERKKRKLYRTSHHNMQRNLLLTIVLLLIVIIALLLFDLLQGDPKPILSDKKLSELKVMMLVLDPKVDEKVIVFGDTHFDFAQSSLTPEAQVLLDDDVQILKDNPSVHVRMAGYTSARGSEEVNQLLSEKRANAVREYLIEKGIAAERITVIGYGRTKPALYEMDPNDIESKEARANMRVLFEINVK
ncbi:MAG: OmpA family protein [Candidatus Marinimicrobia bacterium]|nr:OmpA family protein [Candidatus Neomarinimicrobiota bacterium]